MKSELVAPPEFWKTVGLLLRAARVRSLGRRERQKQLLNNKTGKSSRSTLGMLAILGAIFIALLINGMTAGLVNFGIEASQRYAVEQQGKIVVSSQLYESLSKDWPTDRIHASQTIHKAIEWEARSYAEHYGGRQKEIEDRLWTEILENEGGRLYSEKTTVPGIKALARSSGLPQMIGSLLLFLWLAMMICQGEGMELDLQRRRHPMWEWLLSHPIQPGAVFLAEMLMPLSANSVYWCGPVFVGALYGMVYGLGKGVLAAVLAGIPVTVGAACLGKALEIGVMIRFAPRSRSGILGLMSWLGYAVLLFSFVGFYIVPRLIMATGKYLSLPALLPWPWLKLFLGCAIGSGYNFAAGVLFCWLLGVGMTVAGVSFSLWGAQRGLSGNVGRGDTRVRYREGQRASFGRDPLYRKELLWFLRDRGAIVQAILIPITAAGFQLFNMRGLLEKAQGEWNYLCGAAICFGTYFLWVLGPKSLISEGTALWIPLTWPRGLESLLKAKAWLWAMVSTVLVLLVLLYAAVLYPGDLWKIALVLVGWFLFARSMAEKSVTLVSVASSSGEAPKIPSGRRWATQLGMLTFSIGVITQQWHLAIVGIVFSYMTAAAMWQNFRARLPYLYDPWSEKLPSPPTVMHAMISISAMLEVTSILTAIIAIFGGRSHLGLAMLFGYGISSVVVCLVTMNFLYNRNVPPGRIWNWPVGALPTDELPGEVMETRSENYGGSVIFANYKEKPKFSLKPLIANLQELLPLIAFGAAAGAVLGALAHGYTFVLRLLPSVREMLQTSAEQMTQNPDVRISYGLLAVCFAPFAEEYLFRGLLFRTLDREWGGWKAVLASSLFFTVYHPVLAWIPVFTLGVLNCLLFKKSGKLLPTVVLHMVYNLVVSIW
ncbi:MAG: CPBP family intramembrane glutamic endopeptidase [Terracidiphilus sp.]|jgi:membrane protease YdiL (CAAX protease family)